jgi:Leucine-rich repeat (LRR) protein
METEVEVKTGRRPLPDRAAPIGLAGPLVVSVAGLLLAGCGEHLAFGPSTLAADPLAAAGQRIIAGRIPEAGHPSVASTVALVEAARPTLAFCSGTLVAPRLVVTAAHCVRRRSVATPDFQVLFGASAWDREAKRVPVAGFGVPTPSSASHFPNFDLAWVKLAEDAPEGAVPVEILQDPAVLQSLREAPDFHVTLSGFGLTATNCPGGGSSCAGQKRTVDVRFKEYLRSSRFFHLLVLSEPGVGACNGDSGGPAYVRWNERWYLIGATNGATAILTPEAIDRGRPRCENGGSIHTFVGAYSRWLQDASGVALSLDSDVNPMLPDEVLATDEPADFRGWYGFDNHRVGVWSTVSAILAQLASARGSGPDEETRRLYFDAAFASEQADGLKAFSHSAANFGPLDDGALDDLRPLGTLRALESLDLTAERISDLTSLQGHPGLEALFISQPRLAPGATLALEPLASIPRLARLGLDGLGDHAQLAALHRADGGILVFSALTSFWAASSTLTSLDFVQSLPALETLTLERVTSASETGRLSLAPLASLRHLSTLRLPGNAGTFDWSAASESLPPAALASVRELSLGNNGLSELGFLQAFPNLEQLNLSNNPLGDGALLEIAKLEKLRGLRLSGTEVTDLSALRALPSLTAVEAQVSPYRPLECPIPQDRPGRWCLFSHP